VPQTSLECVLAIKSAMTVQPISASFGMFSVDDEVQTRTLTLTPGDVGSIHPKIVSTGADQITAELKEIEPGQKYELTVKLTPPWPERGIVRGRLVLDTGVEDKEVPPEKITVYGRVAPRLAALPSQFRIRSDPDQDRDYRVRLRWSNNDPGEVKNVRVTHDALQAEVQGNGAIQTLVLHVPAGYEAPAGAARPRVIVQTDDPSARTLQIPIYETPAPARGRPVGRKTGT
jgi:hypothetical protein